MLQQLLHGRLGEVCVVVTRYFGGIKLGTGGLVRAYQGMAALALESAPVREHMIPTLLEVILDYRHITPFLRLLPVYGAGVESETFGVDVVYRIALPQSTVPAFCEALQEMTEGAVLIHETEA